MKIPIKYLKMSGLGLVSLALVEGYRTDAYLDIVGVPTIGFGETQGVKLGDKTSPEKALKQLIKSTDTHGVGMESCLNKDVKLEQHQYDAFLSFTYNIGVAGFCRSETRRLINEGKIEEACHAMMGWLKPKSLRGRREKEVKMCLGLV